MGSSSNNEIVKNAIKDCLDAGAEKINNEYFLLCNNLFTIIHKSQEKNIKLLTGTDGDNNTGMGKVYDDDDLNNPVLIHYFRDKIIPKATWLYRQ
jgi:hypothetical protein